MLNAFILAIPGQPKQHFEFDSASEFSAIRAFHRARKLATHKYAQLYVLREVDGFDVPPITQIGFSSGRPELSFCDAIQVYRGQVSRREFERRIRVSQSRLVQWEAGLVVPTEQRLQELCEALPGLGELMRGERRAG